MTSWLAAFLETVIAAATFIASIPLLIIGESIAMAVLALMLLPFVMASSAIGNFIQRKWGWAARRRASEIVGMVAVALLLWLPIVATILAVVFFVGRALLSQPGALPAEGSMHRRSPFPSDLG